MTEILTWIENTGLAVWVRESVSLWAFPGILSFHTFGLAFLVGISAAFDLRVLGIAKSIPLHPMRQFFRAAWLGFWVNTISGVLLLMAYATSLAKNPVFIVKMVLVFLAVANMYWLNRTVYAASANDLSENRLPEKARMLALSSLGLWFGAIVTGRLVAYIDLVKGLFT